MNWLGSWGLDGQAQSLRSLVEIDDYLVGDRIALAAKDEPARDLVIFECEVDVHVDFALEQLGTARRAHAALARIRQLDALPQRRVEDVLLRFLDRVLARGAVQDHGDSAFRVAGRWRGLRLALVVRDARRKQLDLDARLRH